MVYNIYIGYDSSNYGQELAWEVCRKSILRHCSNVSKIRIIKLVRQELIDKGIFNRKDNSGSTEFTYTRFLIPYLNNYKDYALFMDSDFLWKGDILKLFENFKSERMAVSCVKHTYTNCNGKLKMDGQQQEWYPRKNWSSLMLFNCANLNITKNLNLENVNQKSPKWLHRMEWCEDNEILDIPLYYNYLVGYYNNEKDKINALHFTDGGPWHENYQDVEFGEEWLEYLSEDESEKLKLFLKSNESND